MDHGFKIEKILSLGAIFSILPQIVFADSVISLIDAAFGVITGILIPLAFALCIFYFFWGVVKYIRTGAGSDKAAEEGKRIMIWGIVGIFVAFSIWGIITFIKSELGIPNVQNIDRPTNENVSTKVTF